jgi:uncharacterized protein (UPF0332 family)
VTTEEGGPGALSLGRLKRARQHLKSARDLLSHDDFTDSVSRSYYAVFQAARALLALEQLESRKHSGVIALFNRHFVKTGRVEKQLGAVLMDARRHRELADYSELVEFSCEDAEAQLKDAEMFVEKVAMLLREKKEE